MSAPIARRRRPPSRIWAVYAALVVLCAVFLTPLYWLIASALKPSYEVFVFPPVWWPAPAKWVNFVAALTQLPFARYALNTMLIALLCVVGNVASSAVVAFGFSRFRFRGRGVLFVVLLATLMIPYQVVLVPQFILFHALGWVNTFLPLTVPAFFGSAFYIFLFRQFFLTIPRELEDAAVIDGASWFQVFTRVILPLAKPAVTAVAIFSFQGAWNDFLAPLIYLDSPGRFTLQLGLSLFQGSFRSEWNLMMAASLAVMFPLVVLFFVLQRYFVQGITLTGVKG